jgi:hypothetical protein
LRPLLSRRRTDLTPADTLIELIKGIYFFFSPYEYPRVNMSVALVVGETGDMPFARWVRSHWKNLGSLTVTVSHPARGGCSEGLDHVVHGVAPWDDLGSGAWDLIFYPSPPSTAHLLAFLPRARTALAPTADSKIYVYLPLSPGMLSVEDLNRVCKKTGFSLIKIFDQIPGGLLVQLSPVTHGFSPQLPPISEDAQG